MSRVVVLGASANPARFSYKAVRRLISYDHDVIAIGKRAGIIGDIAIITTQPEITGVHTVVMYLAPYHQGEIFDYVSVKATTNEKMGFVGKEEGMTAYAVVLISRRA